MRTNSVLTPCKQGAVLSRYSHAPKVKKCGFENKYLLTFSLSTSAKKPPTLRGKKPQTPRKNFLSNVKNFISEVKMPFFCPKKEEKTRCLWALSSSLIQRYNIFRRNPNRFNISQYSKTANLQRFAADGVWHVLSYEVTTQVVPECESMYRAFL